MLPKLDAYTLIGAVNMPAAEADRGLIGGDP